MDHLNLSQSELSELVRGDLVSFIQMTFAQLNPQTSYVHNWHIDVLAAYLEAVRRGEIRRLIINIPPRFLKSICTSVAFPAWLLGHKPSTQILCASYGQDLSTKHAFDCRAVMQSDWYRSIFPTRLSDDRRSVTDFQTTAYGARLSTSVGGVLTGRGADIIIIDDPLKPDEALSDTLRRNANDWLENTVFSRLNDKSTGAIVVIMQRLHLDDLTGHLLEKGGWALLSLPAIAERDEVFDVQTPLGPRRYRRSTGKALHPARESIALLDELRRNLGEYNFSGQYQQSPVPLGGGLVKLDWLRYYEPHERPEEFDQIVQSWDTANKETELADFSVGTTWGIKDKKVYLLDVYRRKMNFPDLKRAVIEGYWRHKPNTILVEDRASGTQLVQELVQASIYVTKAIKPVGDKLMRMHAQTTWIENGAVLFPKSAPWLDAYVTELTTFPKGRHDDQVDSTSQFLHWAGEGLSEPGIITFCGWSTRG